MTPHLLINNSIGINKFVRVIKATITQIKIRCENKKQKKTNEVTKWLAGEFNSNGPDADRLMPPNEGSLNAIVGIDSKEVEITFSFL